MRGGTPPTVSRNPLLISANRFTKRLFFGSPLAGCVSKIFDFRVTFDPLYDLANVLHPVRRS